MAAWETSLQGIRHHRRSLSDIPPDRVLRRLERSRTSKGLSVVRASSCSTTQMRHSHTSSSSARILRQQWFKCTHRFLMTTETRFCAAPRSSHHPCQSSDKESADEYARRADRGTQRIAGIRDSPQRLVERGHVVDLGVGHFVRIALERELDVTPERIDCHHAMGDEYARVVPDTDDVTDGDVTRSSRARDHQVSAVDGWRHRVRTDHDRRQIEDRHRTCRSNAHKSEKGSDRDRGRPRRS